MLNREYDSLFFVAISIYSLVFLQVSTETKQDQEVRSDIYARDRS